MELDEFKTLLKQKQHSSFEIKTLPETEIVLHFKTESIVSKLKQNLIMEMLFTAAFMLFAGYIAITSETIFIRLFALLMGAFCIWFVFYLVKLYKKISYDHLTISSVKESLRHLIKMMTQFTRLYFQLTMFMIPVIMLLAFFYSYLDHDLISGNSLDSFLMRRLWAFFGLSAAWFGLMYIFTGWYIKRLYGNYLQSLKSQLRDLEHED